MPETDLNHEPKQHYLLVLLYVLVLVGLGFVFVGAIVGYLLALIPFNGDAGALEQVLSDPTAHPGARPALYIIQSSVTVVGLVLTPAIILRRYGLSFSSLFTRDRPAGAPVLATVLLVFVFMGVNSLFIEWNAGMDLPQFADGLEQWLREREDAAADLTKAITTFTTGWELLAGLIVIAMLPAFGEEVVFRGLIQNILFRGTKNIHVAIWISAAIFSAIHLQFFGFIPRLLLGALFGYIYFWSGSLWLAVIAHFCNNAISVVALYFFHKGALDINIESPEAVPAQFAIASAAISAGLLYYLYRHFYGHKRTFPRL